MIINIDGYDGTGKTSLAKEIALDKGFIYVEKPFILKYQCEYGCSYDDALRATEKEEKILYAKGTTIDKIRYYLDGILWLKRFQYHTNIVLDRGIMTTYAVFGTDETKNEFIKYLEDGIGYDLSIYLTADDMIRHNRILLNDPNDPDLKYPIKWRKNDLEEFAADQGINFYKICTDTLTMEEVRNIAFRYIDQLLEQSPMSPQQNKSCIKRTGDINV